MLPQDIEAKALPHNNVEGAASQKYIDTFIKEATKRQPPPLSPEEQHKKNHAAIAVLREWREEDKTDDPEEIARRQAEWEEFKVCMNAAPTSNRIIYP